MIPKKSHHENTLVLEKIPNHISESEVFNLSYYQKVSWREVNTIKKLTNFNDTIISIWLNVSVKTLRSYRERKSKFKINVQEHVFLLLSLFKHGHSVFGTKENFDVWLNTKNFFFDNKNPNEYLNTITGIKFVDDRLTAMEYGDNV